MTATVPAQRESGTIAVPRPSRLTRPVEIVLAGVIILGALSLRLALLGRGLPPFDSDEATMGLMALHIQRGAHPIFFYGQVYMGAVEAYLAAVSFTLFGPSVFTLRLGLLLLDTLFLIAAYLLMRLLYGVRMAVLSLLILALGSQEILSRELKAVGGYPETLLFAAAVLLCASWLAISPPALPVPRRYIYALCGLCAGLGLWSDPIILPFLFTGALLFISCRRDMARDSALLLVAGLLLGASPLLIALFSEPLAGGPLAALLALLAHGGTTAGGGDATLLEGLVGTVVVSLPAVTGGNGLCTLSGGSAWPLTAATAGCSAVHAAWSAVVTALLAAGIAAAVLSARRSADSADRARSRARLALLGGGALTLLLYAVSPAPRHSPTFTVRYLTSLWLCVPALLAPLLSSARAGRTVRAGGVGALAVLLIALLGGTGSFLNEGPAARVQEQQRQALLSTLQQARLTRIYSDYWTCDAITFLSHERVICAVLNARLQPGVDRYLPYRSAVRLARHAADVFPAGSPQGDRLALLPGCARRSMVAGYVVYERGPRACL